METHIVPDSFPSLMAAYTCVWALLSLYIFSLGRRLRKLEKNSLDQPK